MKSSAKKIELASVDDLFSSEESRQEADRPAHQTYAEFEHDTCMAQSDYLKLRELLGYKQLDPCGIIRG